MAKVRNKGKNKKQILDQIAEMWKKYLKKNF